MVDQELRVRIEIERLRRAVRAPVLQVVPRVRAHQDQRMAVLILEVTRIGGNPERPWQTVSRTCGSARVRARSCVDRHVPARAAQSTVVSARAHAARATRAAVACRSRPIARRMHRRLPGCARAASIRTRGGGARRRRRAAARGEREPWRCSDSVGAAAHAPRHAESPRGVPRAPARRPAPLAARRSCVHASRCMSDPTSQRLFERASELFPGGVNSPVRAFRAVGGEPVFIARARGRGRLRRGRARVRRLRRLVGRR